jgi:putative hydroxymethylpyrimidine transport system substrate-binding protein
MSPRRFDILLGIVVLLVLLAIAGCGDSGTGESSLQHEGFSLLDLTLDGEPDPETAGILTADDLGIFREAGIGLTVAAPVAPERPIGYVADGLADVVVSQMPAVVLAHAEGLPVVAFGSVVAEPTMAMIWLKGSGIDSVADLRGKTIATPGVPFQSSFLEAILRQNGVSPNQVKVVIGEYQTVDLLAEERVDAIFGASGNVEGAMLEAQGLDPVVTPVTELGVPEYDELVFVARRDRLTRHPDLYRRLVEATATGAHAAEEDPAVGGKAVVDHYFGGPPPQHILAGLDATLPLLSGDGKIDPARTADLIAWMHREGMIKREPQASTLLFEE